MHRDPEGISMWSEMSQDVKSQQMDDRKTTDERG